MTFSDNSYPLPGWLLRIQEVSNGHFMVSLTDAGKRRIELTCADAELSAKVLGCIDWAREIVAGDFTTTKFQANG